MTLALRRELFVRLFTSIAPRYDLLNHVLSFNVDRLWWRSTARTFAHVFSQPDSRILDLCCGTGDMTFALCKQARNYRPCILGADFSHAMLQRARSKSPARLRKTAISPCLAGSKPTRFVFHFPASTSTS